MPFLLHVLPAFFLEALAGAAAFLLVVLLAPAQARAGGGVLLFVVGAAVAMGALQLMRRLVVRKIPAQCPRCGGAAYSHGIRPIAFHCTACGHRQETRWRKNI